jgi:hypothetical protein
MQDMTVKQPYATAGEPIEERVIREDGGPLDAIQNSLFLFGSGLAVMRSPWQIPLL